jgi:hypothetical protein
MKRFLTAFNIFMSRLSTLTARSGGLHHARFALPHELATLTSHTVDEEALLLGRTHLGGIYRVKGTPKRPELGNMLVCAPPPVRELPPLADIVFPTSSSQNGMSGEWRRGGGLRFPIDPDDYN